MLSPIAKSYIDASVPALKTHGTDITKTFYQSMFSEHPELRSLFNMGNQANGTQQQSLAATLFAYAANIENAAALTPVVERIAHKHASVGITAAQYPIVGHHLIKAIQTVLGEDAPQPLVDAWTEAYDLLADILINAEKDLYHSRNQSPGEWIKTKVVSIESFEGGMTSYVIGSINGQPLPSFKPGQYISVQGYAPDLGLKQIRQYSLSDAPDQWTYRITVKAEPKSTTKPEGAVSNWLKKVVTENSVLNISMPYGNFTPDIESEQPITLLSAGVGITPMLSILNAIAKQNPSRKVMFAHAAQSVAAIPHLDEIDAANNKMDNLDIALFVKTKEKAHPNVIEGRVDISLLRYLNTAEYYLCGSQNFMDTQLAELIKLGVDRNKVFREIFGPESLSHLL